MTVHADDGRLTAYLDQELPSQERSELETHLRACLTCRHALGRVRRRIEVLRGALAHLDRPAPTHEAWQAVRRAIEGHAPSQGAVSITGRRPRAWAPARWTLARAAGLVLLLAGGAAAAVVPGSPVRAWLFGDSAPAGTAATEVASPSSAVESGSWTRAVDGRVVIELAIPAGSEIVVVQSGDRAGVAGPADARYTSREDGHLAAEADGGPVRVELPERIREATLTVNGVDVLVVRDGTPVRTPDGALGSLSDAREGLRFIAR